MLDYLFTISELHFAWISNIVLQELNSMGEVFQTCPFEKDYQEASKEADKFDNLTVLARSICG